ncbi:NUDIX domain-containing protein [Candidatus Woesearchaeota archaeon]|nr:NUDIX domain-containing protein [Candidatus Woesearchaeota archaeon]
MTEPKLFIATKAFILDKGKVLILKESTKYKDGANAGKYDLPGGRLKPGEHYNDALKREVKEETGLDVEIHQPFCVNEWRPTVKGEQWHIVGVFFQCTTKTNSVTLSEDHEAYEWIEPEEHPAFNIIETNRPAFLAHLKQKPL